MTRLTQTANHETVSIYECDADAPTSKATLEKVVKNTAFTWDCLLGSNSPPADRTINHTGSSGDDHRGALLGVPIMNQGFITGYASFDSTTEQGFTILAPFPIFVPEGETHIRVDVRLAFNHYEPVFFRLLSTAHSTVVDIAMNEEGNGWYTTSRQALGNAGASTVYHCFVYTNVAAVESGNYVRTVRVHHDRIATSEQAASLFQHNGEDNRYTVPNIGGVPSFTDVDSVFVADEMPIASIVPTYTNLNQNLVEEYLLGSPAATNVSLTLADSGDTNPATSSFHDHSRAASKTSEPMVDFPVWCETFGACSIAGTVTSIGWAAPGIKSASAGTLCAPQIYIPDFPAGGSSNLKAEILVARPDSGAWAVGYESTISIQCDALAASTASVTRIGTTNFGRASLSGINFTPDALNSVAIGATSTALKNADGTDLIVLGGCLYFEVP